MARITLKQIEDEIELLNEQFQECVEDKFNIESDMQDLEVRLNLLEDARRRIEDEIRDDVDHDDEYTYDDAAPIFEMDWDDREPILGDWLPDD